MHILFSYGLTGRGGDAIQIQALTEAFQRLGHNVYLLGPHPLQPYQFSDRGGQLRTRLRQLPWWARDVIELGLNVLVLFKARRFLRQHQVDMIFHRAGIYDLVGARLAAHGHCPVVVYLDAPFPLERAFRGEGYFKRLHHRAMRRLGQRAQLIVTVSRPARDYFVHLGLPAEKIMIQPNGISQRLLEKGQALSQAHKPFNNEPYTIGFVGSLARWHRVDLLLEALHLIPSHEADKFRLTVVGYGEEYKRLIERVRELDLGAQVRWLGPMPHERAFEQIAQLDIAVLPHTLPTGAPMKLFEYAALARPTIAPDLSNLRDLFAEDEMHFVEPGNPRALAKAMLWLAQHPEEAVQLGQRAQARVQGYSWEEIIQRLLRSLT